MSSSNKGAGGAQEDISGTSSRRVFLTGGTGFIGSALVRALGARGDVPVVLTRSPDKARQRLEADTVIVSGDPELGGDWQSELCGANAVVHLAGESVASKRWSARQKQIIRDSRVESTRNLVEALAACPAEERPAVLVSASGVDYYPFSHELGLGDDDAITESDPPGDSFLARVCRAWEQEARGAEAHGTRVVRMRTGLVVGPGGALDKMTTPFKAFIGGPVGSGAQWMSWIHLDDVVRAYLRAIDDATLTGAVNLVAPQPVRAKRFFNALGTAMQRPSWLPVPAFAVRLALGEFAEHVLHGRRAVPQALLAAGFEFCYPEVAPALENAIQND